MIRALTYLLFLLTLPLAAQVRPTPAADRATAFEQRQRLAQSSPLARLEPVSIGPSIMSGRVTDLAVDPDDPTHFYVGYASGGLWETTDNGTSFTPLFDHESVMTVGDLDVHWPSGTIYLGSGESNSSRSSYAGDGVYKSTDGGRSWTNLGLPESHHIGRLVVDQDNPNRVWVAALGHLYGPNPERGVYLTEDGGQTWTKTLYVDENSGAIDLIRDPRQPNHLYAALWDRERRAWNFRESGPGSGIHRSTDGGKTWTKLSTATSGFPSGAGAGRIGLAITYGPDGTRHLFASLDNYDRKPAEEADEEVLTKAALRNMPVDEVLRLETYLLDDFLKSNNFPAEASSTRVRAQLESGELTTQQLVEYLDDANSLLFDTPVYGFQVYHSTDDGASWTRTHNADIDDVYYSYGYYFGQLRVEPGNPDRLYAMGVPVITSADGGKNWTGLMEDNVHADHHALWINPDRPKHLILGNDGGVNISYNGGRTWLKANVPSLGQFYAVAVDDHPDGYRVYGGLQDNGTWRGPHDYEPSRGWQQDGEYPYKMLFGGDGMQVQVDPRDHETAYVGFQFGNYYRTNPKNNEFKSITPKHALGQRPYRWNWQTPILISPHQPDIFYMGSNHLHRSFNRGDDFTTISPDLTTGGKKGDVPYGTLTSIDESPLAPGLLLTGSDDGRIHLSENAGRDWQRIDAGLPQNLWVSRIRAGKHDDRTLYASLSGYRNDDFAAYVYKSTDLGKTWQRIGQNLPMEPVNVVYEDKTDPDLLYVGTDHGLYFSQDQGRSFTIVGGMPAVAVHDVVVHEGSQEMIVGTHGRSLYRMPLAALRAGAKSEAPLVLVKPEPVRARSSWGSTSLYAGKSEPEFTLEAFVRGAVAGGELVVKGADGTVLFSKPVSLANGYTAIDYDLTVADDVVETYAELLNKDRKADTKPVRVKAADDGRVYLRPGTYTVEVRGSGEMASTELIIK